MVDQIRSDPAQKNRLRAEGQAGTEAAVGVAEPERVAVSAESPPPTSTRPAPSPLRGDIRAPAQTQHVRVSAPVRSGPSPRADAQRAQDAQLLSQLRSTYLSHRPRPQVSREDGERVVEMLRRVSAEPLGLAGFESNDEWAYRTQNQGAEFVSLTQLISVLPPAIRAQARTLLPSVASHPPLLDDGCSLAQAVAQTSERVRTAWTRPVVAHALQRLLIGESEVTAFLRTGGAINPETMPQIARAYQLLNTRGHSAALTAVVALSRLQMGLAEVRLAALEARAAETVSSLATWQQVGQAKATAGPVLAELAAERESLRRHSSVLRRALVDLPSNAAAARLLDARSRANTLIARLQQVNQRLITSAGADATERQRLEGIRNRLLGRHELMNEDLRRTVARMEARVERVASSTSEAAAALRTRTASWHVLWSQTRAYGLGLSGRPTLTEAIGQLSGPSSAINQSLQRAQVLDPVALGSSSDPNALGRAARVRRSQFFAAHASRYRAVADLLVRHVNPRPGFSPDATLVPPRIDAAATYAHSQRDLHRACHDQLASLPTARTFATERRHLLAEAREIELRAARSLVEGERVRLNSLGRTQQRTVLSAALGREQDQLREVRDRIRVQATYAHALQEWQESGGAGETLEHLGGRMRASGTMPPSNPAPADASIIADLRASEARLATQVAQIQQHLQAIPAERSARESLRERLASAVLAAQTEAGGIAGHIEHHLGAAVHLAQREAQETQTEPRLAAEAAHRSQVDLAHFYVRASELAGDVADLSPEGARVHDRAVANESQLARHAQLSERLAYRTLEQARFSHAYVRAEAIHSQIHALAEVQQRLAYFDPAAASALAIRGWLMSGGRAISAPRGVTAPAPDMAVQPANRLDTCGAPPIALSWAQGEVARAAADSLQHMVSARPSIPYTLGRSTATGSMLETLRQFSHSHALAAFDREALQRELGQWHSRLYPEAVLRARASDWQGESQRALSELGRLSEASAQAAHAATLGDSATLGTLGAPRAMQAQLAVSSDHQAVQSILSSRAAQCVALAEAFQHAGSERARIGLLAALAGLPRTQGRSEEQAAHELADIGNLLGSHSPGQTTVDDTFVARALAVDRGHSSRAWQQPSLVHQSMAQRWDPALAAWLGEASQRPLSASVSEHGAADDEVITTRTAHAARLVRRWQEEEVVDTGGLSQRRRGAGWAVIRALNHPELANAVIDTALIEALTFGTAGGLLWAGRGLRSAAFATHSAEATSAFLRTSRAWRALRASYEGYEALRATRAMTALRRISHLREHAIQRIGSRSFRFLARASHGAATMHVVSTGQHWLQRYAARHTTADSPLRHAVGFAAQAGFNLAASHIAHLTRGFLSRLGFTSGVTFAQSATPFLYREAAHSWYRHWPRQWSADPQRAAEQQQQVEAQIDAEGERFGHLLGIFLPAVHGAYAGEVSAHHTQARLQARALLPRREHETPGAYRQRTRPLELGLRRLAIARANAVTPRALGELISGLESDAWRVLPEAFVREQRAALFQQTSVMQARDWLHRCTAQELSQLTVEHVARLLRGERVATAPRVDYALDERTARAQAALLLVERALSGEPRFEPDTTQPAASQIHALHAYLAGLERATTGLLGGASGLSPDVLRRAALTALQISLAEQLSQREHPVLTALATEAHRLSEQHVMQEDITDAARAYDGAVSAEQVSNFARAHADFSTQNGGPTTSDYWRGLRAFVQQNVRTLGRTGDAPANVVTVEVVVRALSRHLLTTRVPHGAILEQLTHALGLTQSQAREALTHWLTRRQIFQTSQPTAEQRALVEGAVQPVRERQLRILAVRARLAESPRATSPPVLNTTRRDESWAAAWGDRVDTGVRAVAEQVMSQLRDAPRFNEFMTRLLSDFQAELALSPVAAAGERAENNRRYTAFLRVCLRLAEQHGWFSRGDSRSAPLVLRDFLSNEDFVRTALPQNAALLIDDTNISAGTRPHGAFPHMVQMLYLSHTLDHLLADRTSGPRSVHEFVSSLRTAQRPSAAWRHLFDDDGAPLFVGDPLNVTAVLMGLNIPLRLRAEPTTHDPHLRMRVDVARREGELTTESRQMMTIASRVQRDGLVAALQRLETSAEPDIVRQGVVSGLIGRGLSVEVATEAFELARELLDAHNAETLALLDHLILPGEWQAPADVLSLLPMLSARPHLRVLAAHVDFFQRALLSQVLSSSRAGRLLGDPDWVLLRDFASCALRDPSFVERVQARLRVLDETADESLESRCITASTLAEMCREEALAHVSAARSGTGVSDELAQHYGVLADDVVFRHGPDLLLYVKPEGTDINFQTLSRLASPASVTAADLTPEFYADSVLRFASPPSRDPARWLAARRCLRAFFSTLLTHGQQRQTVGELLAELDVQADPSTTTRVTQIAAAIVHDHWYRRVIEPFLAIQGAHRLSNPARLLAGYRPGTAQHTASIDTEALQSALIAAGQTPTQAQENAHYFVVLQQRFIASE